MLLKVLRTVGNILILIGYIALTNGGVLWGILISLLGELLCYPYFCKAKMWDLVVVTSFFFVANIAALVKYLTHLPS